MMSQGTIITFYSYKGGVGRTMALANVGVVLAEWGFRVLCVDWDLEAPGLRAYFQPYLAQPLHPGLVEWVTAITSGEPVDWRTHTVPVKAAKTNGRLHLLSAGRTDDDYVQRLQAIRWETVYEQHGIGDHIEQMRDDWKAQYDFVLVDSRTGITDIGGICTIQLPDILVLLFTANDQSLQGVMDVATRAAAQRQHLPVDRSHLLCVPIPSRFEGRVEYTLAQQWSQKFAKVLAPLYADWLPTAIEPLNLLGVTKLPYVPYWSFGERLPVVDEGSHDPESLGYALETVAALLAHRLDKPDLLLEDRDGYVNDFRRGTGKPVSRKKVDRKPLTVFVIYSPKDTELFLEMKAALAPEIHRGILEIRTADQMRPYRPWLAQYTGLLNDCDVAAVLVTDNLPPSGSSSGAGSDVKLLISAALNERHQRLLPVWLPTVSTAEPDSSRTEDWDGVLKELASYPGLPSIYRSQTTRSDLRPPEERQRIWQQLREALIQLADELHGNSSAQQAITDDDIPF